MKTIEEVRPIIEQYLQDRFEVERGRWDLGISKYQHDRMIDEMFAKYYVHPAIIETYFNRYLRQEIELQDSSDVQHQYNITLLPPLFIIREYYNPSVGRGISLENNTIYNAIVGSSDFIGIPLPPSYVACLTFTELDGELKMICERTKKNGLLPNRMIRWDVQDGSVFDENDIKIIDDGKLVNTLRIQAPELPSSLEDYQIG